MKDRACQGSYVFSKKERGERTLGMMMDVSVSER